MKVRTPILCIAVAVLVAAGPADGAVLGLMPGDTIVEGGTIRVPVALSGLGNESVAALQFDLLFKEPLLTFAGIENGASATAGAKSVHANRLRSGQVRVIVAGLNRNVIPEGPVAWILLDSTSDLDSPMELTLGETILSDPYGTAVEVRVTPDTLAIDPAAEVVVASDSGTSRGARTGMEALFRYRALLFAGVAVGMLILISRRSPRKGRAR